MAGTAPKGNLVVPVVFGPNGELLRVEADADGHPLVALAAPGQLIIPPRDFTLKSLDFSDSYSAHAWTARDSFTIPTGKAGMVVAWVGEARNPSAAGLSASAVRLNTVIVFQQIADEGTVIEDWITQMCFNFPVKDGQVVDLASYVSGAGTAFVSGRAHIIYW
ncbi:MAG: hypothetical protein HWN68_11825 [Desulfobacterales bacterium]|nr:hypothetical protein [Desulfobacterales bacterium]